MNEVSVQMSDDGAGSEPGQPGQLAAADPPGPGAVLPPLDAEQLSELQAVGQAWKQSPGPVALPVDPALGTPQATLGGDRFVRLTRVSGGSSDVEAESASGDPGTTFGKAARATARILIGPPLRSTALAQERMRKLVALPVLSADALSSVAYGPESMLVVLVLAGSAGLARSIPIAAAIGFLMLAVGISYRQTIRAYPHGGGSYIVATDNLGRVPGLIAAAGLITDYVLTVTVSVASGLAAITSAIPAMNGSVVPVGVGIIVVLLAVNMRGVKQAGATFAAPTYLFIAAIALLVVVGLVDAAGRGFHAQPRPPVHAVEGVGLLVVLRAFSSGATAMTGIEAISNAVPVFQPVEWRNARTTLTWMVGLLIAMFAGIIALVELGGIVPEHSQTVLSQLAHRDFGGGPLYWFVQAATALVLLLAADTSYNDFPRVMFLLARDQMAPSRYLKMGDRLAFNNGIIALSLIAALIFVVFRGNTERLIPLYAVGVFLAFTLSQAGMVVHWWRQRGAGWLMSLWFNGVGCVMSAVVFVIAAATKFTEGAWVALLIVVLFTAVALVIRSHYQAVDRALELGAPPAGDDPEVEERPDQVSHLVIVTVGTLNQASMQALAYAASFDQPVLALHVSPTTEEAQRFRDYWATWGNHLPLEVIESPYRALIAPTVAYVESLHEQRPDLTLTVVVPDVSVHRWWQRWLLEHNGARLRRALEPLPRVVVTSVPFHIR